jgi:hypothetical protein
MWGRLYTIEGSASRILYQLVLDRNFKTVSPIIGRTVGQSDDRTVSWKPSQIIGRAAGPTTVEA